MQLAIEPWGWNYVIKKKNKKNQKQNKTPERRCGDDPVGALCYF